MSVLDVATGAVTKIHDSLAQPGAPTWSPDGKRIALAAVAPLTRAFPRGHEPGADDVVDRGDADADKWYAPVPMLSIDSRGGCGPVVVARRHEDGGDLRRRARGLAGVAGRRAARTAAPHDDRERALAELGGRLAAHPLSVARQAADRRHRDRRDAHRAARPQVDARRADGPHGRPRRQAGRHEEPGAAHQRRHHHRRQPDHERRAACRRQPRGGRVVDASNLTVMPGLIEFHSHLQKDFGEAQGRAWLAFGVTTVAARATRRTKRSRIARRTKAGVRPGPRVYGTGYLMEWQRVYYKMGIAISSVAQFEMELQRAKVLQHDLIKSYVRLPDLQQKRMVEFAHSIGVPVATPRDLSGGVRRRRQHRAHGATSRRGYSPKIATLQRSYEDVVQLFGKSGRIFCPMISGGGDAEAVRRRARGSKNDPRFKLYPRVDSARRSRRSPVAAKPAAAAIRPAAAARW